MYYLLLLVVVTHDPLAGIFGLLLLFLLGHLGLGSNWNTKTVVDTLSSVHALDPRFDVWEGRDILYTGPGV